MADLAPFRAWRYSPEKVPELGAVVAPPYDVIDRSLQRALHERHPLNVIRLILGEILAGDGEESNRYTRAATYLNQWQREGVLIRDRRPSLYLYHKAFQGPHGRRLVRRGFIALLHLEPLDRGKVFPHEETFPKHKMDRLLLMRTCSAHFNPIFSLFSDPEGAMKPFLHSPSRDPDMHAVDDDGVVHDLWVLQNPQLIASIIQAMKEKSVFIADGHHRYETCLRYREERETLLGRRDASDPFQWTLMYFTPMEEEGLVIYPTHKMVRGVRGFRRSSFLRRLRKDFLVQEFPFGEGVEDKTRRLFLQTLERDGQTQSAIGLLIHGDRVYRVVTPRDPQRLIKRLSRVPECVRDLDVTLLHEVVFRQFLKIDVTDPKDQHLSYVHDLDQSLKQALEGQVQIAFIMNPTRVEDLKSVASARCKMPQKATYFYPKLLSGLVINVMKDGESIIAP